MKHIRGIENLTESLPHAVVTIGNFDGVHLGHRKIIAIAMEKARQRNGSCIAFTFRPHPRVALGSEANIQLLTTYDEKIELLGQLGVDMTIEEPFSRTFSTVEPEQFLNDLLLHRLSAEAIVVGYDFSFGKERTGHLPALESFCKKAGVELTIVPAQRIDGEIVSSSRIRQHLLAGELKQANHLLGTPFFYRGVVIRGEGRGRKLGFPTANLKLENKLTLPFGVYATWAVIDGQRYPSVTNVGTRPTFYPDPEHQLPALVETHILNTRAHLYGKILEVRFMHRLREERRFGSIDELKAQIHSDCEKADAILTKIGPVSHST